MSILFEYSMKAFASLTRFWLVFFMDVKWLGGVLVTPPPLVISRTKQARNMIFSWDYLVLNTF